MRVEAAVTIDRPLGEVYDFLADATNDPKWCPPVKDCRKVGAGDDADSTRYEAAVKPGPRALTSAFEVSTRARPDRITWHGRNEAGRFEGQYSLAPVAGGTRVTMVSDLELQGAMKLLTPIVLLMSRANARQQFERLERLLTRPA